MKIEEIWPEWQVEREIGHGSYGTVYKCVRKTESIEEYSAIKVISIPSDDNQDIILNKEKMTGSQKREYYAEIKDGLVNEVKLLISLKGAPNIVNIEDYKVIEKTDRVGWEIFIRMELLTDLNSYFADRDISEEEVMKLGTDICAALSLCEKRKIVHRDIKPENIFVSEFGVFKLGDFGVAKQFDGTASSMSVKGTFNYMAPEVANNHHGDIRSDIYSLGVVMYQLLNNNRLPLLDPEKTFIKHSERVQALEKRMDGAAIPPLRNVNAELGSAILRALAFNVNNRYSSASEFSRELKKIDTDKSSVVKVQKDIQRVTEDEKPETEPVKPAVTQKTKKAAEDKKRQPAAKKVPAEKKASFFSKHSGLVIVICVAIIASIAAGLCINTILKNKGGSGDVPDGGDVSVGGSTTFEGDIKYSGIINNGLYTYKGIDYCAGIADENGSRLYAVSESAKRLLTDKTVTADFTIINSEIYFTVIDEDKTEKKSYDSSDEENVVNCSCWKMSTDGTNEKKLFDYDGSGFVVWADEKNVYYMDTKNDTRFGYSLKRIELKDEDGADIENPSPVEIISGYKANAAGGVSEFGCDRENVFCNQKYIICGIGNNSDVHFSSGKSYNKNDVFLYEIGSGDEAQKLESVSAEKLYYDGSNSIYAKPSDSYSMIKYSIAENKTERVSAGEYELEGLYGGKPIFSDDKGALYNENSEPVQVGKSAEIKAFLDGKAWSIGSDGYLIFEDKSIKLNGEDIEKCRLSCCGSEGKTILKFYNDRNSEDIVAAGRNVYLYGESEYKNAVYKMKWDSIPNIHNACADKIEIPDFKSLKLNDEITAYLDFLGIVIDPQNEEVFDETIEAGAVVSQSITEGAVGGTIKFTVSKGVDPRNTDYYDATDADWKNFTKFFSVTNVPNRYNFEIANPEDVFYSCIYTDEGLSGYKYYFGIPDVKSASSEPDPNGWYVVDEFADPEIPVSDQYIVLPKNNVDWILSKVFGITAEIPDLSNADRNVYLDNGNYYLPYNGNFADKKITVKNKTQDETGKYTVACDCSGTQLVFTAALMQKPDKGKYWTVFTIN